MSTEEFTPPKSVSAPLAVKSPAQALMAAGRTVEHGRVHSLHSYFLRPGDTTTPILYEVDRIRDGKSFSTRRVVAIQHGRAIYNMQASFHSDEQSIEHQVEMPAVPAPETIKRISERLADDFGVVDEWFQRQHPIDQRYIGELPWDPNRSKEPVQRIWIRADGKLPDDPLLHACVVTYASDMSLFDSIIKPHSISWDEGTFMGASLDHCMWFPPRVTRGRMVAVRHGLAHRLWRAWPSARVFSSPRMVNSRCRWSRKD